ncbi:unnamed protein product [Bursaphelenchus xylophilus]|uniref:(pine wood nematode) hypothetical protein n=1 Tax=Bursaphelenchus xylophilus TaxID=6326 RepID=A0A1I7RZ64_BURXY|nr:unnamed protein product [Bursaphelenchus xylophilus]CAG9106808.1 unnamed protein product [Bursaphelenchus xylophilus]
MRELIVRATLVALLCGQVHCQFRDDCSDAPNTATRNMCLRMRQMDTNARNIAQNTVEEEAMPPGSPVWQQPIPVPFNARGQLATHPYDCMTLQCLCPFFRGQMNNGNCILQSGQPLAMGYRKEYRMLNDDERRRWHYALTVLKQSGEYDRLSGEHMVVGAGSGAHSGPGFLPWHREYLKRFEIALRLIDPSVSVPFWDSVMDNYLPDPRDSILFTPDFIGQTDANGFVVNGPFAYWRTLEGRAAIWRQLGMEGGLFTEAQLNNMMQQTNVEYVMAYTVPLPGCPYPPNYQAIEYTHSNIHLWIGGDMKPPTTSANDPIFYMHHSFVDFLWEQWRQLRQPRWLRETQYTPDIAQCANPLHFSYAAMRPFNNLLNRDGLSNSYTDQMYRYAPRAGCSAQIPTCGSKYLFCDTRGFPHCVAKVRLGGLCMGYEGFDACFNGQCIFGRCVPGPTPAPFRIPRPTTTPAPAPAATRRVAVRVRQAAPTPFVDCFNRDPCCEEWARQGECDNNKKYMSRFCKAACHRCTPAFNSTNECPDRHISCQQWSQQGQCSSGNSQKFMQENCRQSCSFCSAKKSRTCPKPDAHKATKPEGPIRRAFKKLRAFVGA